MISIMVSLEDFILLLILGGVVLFFYLRMKAIQKKTVKTKAPQKIKFPSPGSNN